jgi:exopolyphosphatase / guanosine-5'-triphosphate,3'-diphosphate pyrophosphatase
MSGEESTAAGKPRADAHSWQAMGVISIGSNDIHLLVASADGATGFQQQVSQSILAELVGTLEGNVLPVTALNQALGDLRTLVAVARARHAHPILAVGTEALREARNGPAFLELVAATLGIEAFTITGEEEAALDYRWATFASMPIAEDQAPLLAVDSGGGSTQIVLGEGLSPTFSQSLPIGAGNLTERWLDHDPPRHAEMQALQRHVSSLVDTLPPLPVPPQRVVAMGGSADHLVRLTSHPKHWRLTASALDKILVTLQKKTASETARKYELPVPRARLLPAGAVILRTLLAHYGSEVAEVKENGIRGAVVVSYARHGTRWRRSLQGR